MNNATKKELDNYIKIVKKLMENKVITKSEYYRITYRINTHRNWYYVLKH